ncbi:DNA recombination protein RmuC [Pararhodonellum marinum]|uniref:DNA recombination protein RmuC n=1 Tax=Pararhodonellum marinum TaxID=2755358 RepID=UPI001E488104|nr:DNA recombination protein RmuC [Pararhodonellum marinum]
MELILAAVITGLILLFLAGIWINFQRRERRLTASLKIAQDELNAFKMGKAMAEQKAQSAENRGKELAFEFQKFQEMMEKERDDHFETKHQLTSIRIEKQFLQEKLEKQTRDLEELGSKFKQEFKLLATEILEEKSSRFTKQNKENLDNLLSPIKAQFLEFKKTVEETYDKESKERFSLQDKVKELVILNQQISEEAKNLTKALKGNTKTQGNWGEAILETILQNSGLEKGQHYEVQAFLKDGTGQFILGPDGKKMQPDVIIHYPDDRKVIIDAKVSLMAYEQYFNSEGEIERQTSIAAHLKSIKNHVDNLASKQYEGYAKVLDFVIMFVPVEAAYIAAVQSDPYLWEYAYKKRVLLISSSNLIAALKMIKDLWVRGDQEKNALEIAERGGKLYDKFVGFLGSLEDIGKHLQHSRNSYDNAMGLLKDGSGNLIGQVQKLQKLGANARKSIPEKFLNE